MLYLRAIQSDSFVTVGISDGNMEEGSLSVVMQIYLFVLVGEMKFGTRTEIKNINSFKFVQKAL